MASSDHSHGITRRGFLLGAATGLATGIPAAWLAARWSLPPLWDNLACSPLPRQPREGAEYAMPGRYPGRVIEVRHPGAVSSRHEINPEIVSWMVDRGMSELTGAAAG